jgi:hypothetical protein
MNSDSVVLWYQRANGDFRVSVNSVADGYQITVKELDERDPLDTQEFTFRDFEHLQTYLNTLHEQVLNDQDRKEPFTHLQYSVPFFPSVLLSVESLKTNPGYFYRFMQALELYFS